MKYESKANCLYLQELLKEFKSYGFSANVVANEYLWTSIFDDIDFCPEVSYTKLWWIPYED